jgi:putative DNA primase/helicase
MAIGMQDNPLTSDEPARVAEQLLYTEFLTDTNQPGLWNRDGILYMWDQLGSRWQMVSEEEIRQELWRLLKDAMVQEERGEIIHLKRYKPTRQKLGDVLDAMNAFCQLRLPKVPGWLNGKNIEGWDPDYVVAFDDKLVSVRGGTISTASRDENWFDPVTLPVPYRPDAACDRWLQCLDEWSSGDKVWKELLQRMMGYCLLPHTRHAKWFLLHGKVRAGKGTITKVIERLLGLHSYFGTTLFNLSNSHGLEGLQAARVLCVNEVSELDNREGEKCVQVLKSVVGQDRIDINPKMKAMIRNVRIEAVPIMVANEIPKLPNKGQGLSSKMIVLPFDISFAGKEDDHLIDKLEKEMEGIAAWALEGARKVEAETDPKGRFVMPERAEDSMRLYLHTNNPFDSFLSARFQQAPKGFVATKLIWDEWRDWLAVNKIKGVHVARNQIAVKIEQESSWPVRRYRPSGGTRGLAGMVLRKFKDDEA